MYVAKALIKGFRSLEDVFVNFYPGINVLVGKNNAGKSNIIRALDIVLGEKWPTYREIGDKDFYRASSDTDPVDHFLVTVCLKGKVNTEVIEDEMGASVYPLNNEPIWEDYDDLMNEPGEREYKKVINYESFLTMQKKSGFTCSLPGTVVGESVFSALTFYIKKVGGIVYNYLDLTYVMPS